MSAAQGEGRPFKVGDEVLVRGRIHSLHTSAANKPAAKIDLYDVPYRLSFHLEDVVLASQESTPIGFDGAGAEGGGK